MMGSKQVEAKAAPRISSQKQDEGRQTDPCWGKNRFNTQQVCAAWSHLV